MILLPKNGAVLLRGFRIGTRLVLGFGSILAIVAATNVAETYLRDQSKEKLIAGLKVSEEKTRLAATMKSALLEGGIAMRNIGIQSEVAAMQKEYDNAASYRALFLQSRDKFVSTGLSDTEKTIFSNIAQIDQQMQAPLREAIGQSLAFNEDSAAIVLATRIDPLNRKAIQEINQLVDIQQAAAHDVIVKSVDDDIHLKILLLLVSIVSLGVGALLAWLMARSIIHPLRDAVDVAQNVARGELTSQAHVDGHDEVTELMRALNEMMQCLSVANQKLSDLSHTDGLTGVKNRAYFNEVFNTEWRRGQRAGYMVGLLMLDIDHFKSVNDTYGHLGGDACLKHVAETLNTTIRRAGDHVFRYGGEEFAILLANTEMAGAESIAEIIRKRIEALEIIFDGKKIPVTISVGVAAMIPNDALAADSLIGYADSALYKAKHAGRNKVCVFQEIDE
jgi:diguanylate cyclase (GGDEF)-like protein